MTYFWWHVRAWTEAFLVHQARENQAQAQPATRQSLEDDTGWHFVAGVWNNNNDDDNDDNDHDNNTNSIGNRAKNNKMWLLSHTDWWIWVVPWVSHVFFLRMVVFLAATKWTQFMGEVGLNTIERATKMHCREKAMPRKQEPLNLANLWLASSRINTRTFPPNWNWWGFQMFSSRGP